MDFNQKTTAFQIYSEKAHKNCTLNFIYFTTGVTEPSRGYKFSLIKDETEKEYYLCEKASPIVYKLLSKIIDIIQKHSYVHSHSSK